jgi:hypothetical protein
MGDACNHVPSLMRVYSNMGRTEGGSGFGARELRKKGKEDRCYVALLLRVSATLERDGAVKSGKFRTEQNRARRYEKRRE